MRFNLNRKTEVENWFAWYPVIAELRNPDTGISYHIVWLERVERSYLRMSGFVQRKYVTRRV